MSIGDNPIAYGPGADVRLRITRGPILDLINVEVPTEDGRLCSIDFQRFEGWTPGRRVWTVDIDEELIRQAPQGLTAALLQGFQTVAARLADSGGDA